MPSLPRRSPGPGPAPDSKTQPRRTLCAALALAAVLVSAAIAPPPAAHASGELDSVEPTVVPTTFKSVDAMIAGEWEFPEVTPAPLVVIVPASSDVDRNGLPAGYADDPDIGIYAQLSKRLVREGFAVFRYDSPGTGRSSRCNYCTPRSTALEGYTRAVDHARVDTRHVFLFGHSVGTDTVVGIYPRYEQANPVAGVILLANRVGETDMVRVTTPTLVIVSEDNPEDHYQNGTFVVDARGKVEEPKLETELVVIPKTTRPLVTEIERPAGNYFAIDPRATDAMLRWLHKQVDGAIAG